MDLEALSYENFISLKELFPLHNKQTTPSCLYLIISHEQYPPHFSIAQIGELPSGLSTEKSCIFPLFVDDPTGNGQIPNLNASIINEMEKRLSLAFAPKKLLDPNVCFADSDEVRPEFKNTFAPVDIFDYLLATINSSTFQNELLHVPFPKSNDFFWKLATLGRKLRIAQAVDDDATVSLIIENIAKINEIDDS